MKKEAPEFSPQEEYDLLIQYTLLKLFKRDYHGIMDSSADIRELLAAHPEIKEQP